MNCSDPEQDPKPSPHKILSAAFPEARKKAIRERMTQMGFGEDRNLYVWFFIEGSGWDLVPIEFLLHKFEEYRNQ